MKDIKLFDNARKLYDILVTVSTGSSYSDPIIVSDYNARKALTQNNSISNLLPDFVKKYRDLPAFWGL